MVVHRGAGNIQITEVITIGEVIIKEGHRKKYSIPQFGFYKIPMLTLYPTWEFQVNSTIGNVQVMVIAGFPYWVLMYYSTLLVMVDFHMGCDDGCFIPILSVNYKLERN